MIHRIKFVKPLDDLKILVVFRNGVETRYDITQLYNKFPQFKQLEKESELYKAIRVDVGGYGVVWNDELDLDAEEIWQHGVRTGTANPFLQNLNRIAQAMNMAVRIEFVSKK